MEDAPTIPSKCMASTVSGAEGYRFDSCRGYFDRSWLLVSWKYCVTTFSTCLPNEAEFLLHLPLQPAHQRILKRPHIIIRSRHHAQILRRDQPPHEDIALAVLRGQLGVQGRGRHGDH